MEYLTQFSVVIMNNLQYVLLGMTALILIALIIFININIKLTKLNRRYRKLMQGMDGANIERLLVEHIEEVRQAVKKVDELSANCSQLNQFVKGCVQKVGVVRFNAFEDTGSDLSFALALLDQEDNGVVISSIYGRNENRVYAKPVSGGQSSYYLTAEEKTALQQAQEKITK
jgi:hypothetical protein